VQAALQLRNSKETRGNGDPKQCQPMILRLVGQITKSVRIEDAQDETDAMNIAESEFLDNYAATGADGSGIAWDLVESAESEEIL
jgi:hypothetical protein